VNPENPDMKHPADGVAKTINRSEPLLPSDSIDIRITDGNVSLEGRDRQEIVINARLLATNQRALDEMDLRLERDQGRTLVREDFRSDRPLGSRIDLMVQIPREMKDWTVSLVNGRIFCRHISGHFSLDVINGDVTVHDVEGTGRVSSVNGDLVAHLEAVRHPDRLELVDTNGNIVLRLNREVAAHVSASTVLGQLHENTPVQPHASPSGQILEAELGAGGESIIAHTVTGNVVIDLENSPERPAQS